MGGDFITFYSSARNLHVETADIFLLHITFIKCHLPNKLPSIQNNYCHELQWNLRASCMFAKFSPCLGILSKVVILIICLLHYDICCECHSSIHQINQQQCDSYRRTFQYICTWVCHHMHTVFDLTVSYLHILTSPLVTCMCNK